VFVDDRTPPVTVWVGNNHAAQVMKIEPLDSGASSDGQHRCGIRAAAFVLPVLFCFRALAFRQTALALQLSSWRSPNFG
jgi:hypothetical protein